MAQEWQLRFMKAFLLMAINAQSRGLRKAVQNALSEAGVELANPELRPGAPVGDVLVDAIASADFVIADISNASPNVFYELGYAHAMRKNTLMLVSKNASPKIPSDLEGSFYLTYDPEDPEQVASYITRTALSLKERREAIA